MDRKDLRHATESLQRVRFCTDAQPELRTECQRSWVLISTVWKKTTQLRWMSSRWGTTRRRWSGWREGCAPPTVRCWKARQLSVKDPDDCDQTQPCHVTINKTTQQRKKRVVPWSNRNNKCQRCVRHTQETKHLSCGWPPHQCSLSGGALRVGRPSCSLWYILSQLGCSSDPTGLLQVFLSHFSLGKPQFRGYHSSPYASHYGQP